MGGRLPPRLRHALFLLVVAVLALASLNSLPGVQGASNNYVIVGQVLQPNGFGVPSGVTVQLTSAATHAVYTTTTGTKGVFLQRREHQRDADARLVGTVGPAAGRDPVRGLSGR